VRDSDGTVVFSIAATLSGGSKKTVDFARKQRKPVPHISQEGGPASPEEPLRRFILEHNVRVLNVARDNLLRAGEHWPKSRLDV